jgi:DNA-binding HxlR family transcriptional regulator
MPDGLAIRKLRRYKYRTCILQVMRRGGGLKRREHSTCPVCYGLDLFGDKWTLLIIRDVLLGEKRYYRDFLQSGEGIATNILADRLKHLVENGLLTRTEETDGQPAYLPTDKALALAPVLRAIGDWAMEYGPDTLRRPTPASRARRTSRSTHRS